MVYFLLKYREVDIWHWPVKFSYFLIHFCDFVLGMHKISVSICYRM